MKIQELRIGNIVKYKKGHLAKIIGTHLIDGKEIIEVVGVDDNYINGVYECDNFYPIDLTDRMLFDIGFIHRYNVSRKINQYYLNGILITRSNSGYFYYNKMLINLHKLQNLCFVLTGSELQVNVA